MSLIPWKPLSEFDKFFGNDDWILPVFSQRSLSIPAMDVYETSQGVVAEINAPGMKSEDFDVSVKDGVLRVVGRTEEKKEETSKGYWRKEIRRGSFERTVQLPTAVKEDAVDATYAKGILKITMLKADIKPISQIKVKSGDET